MAYINGKMPGVYASSFNGSTTQIAKDLPHNIGVSFDLVDESMVARLMRDPTLDLSDFQGGINGTKMAAWNSRAISSEILQGIVSGDSMPRIAGRIMNVAGMDMRAAMRNARTMTTGAENAGREDSYLRAQDMGIKLHQQWIAALDGRTRHSHRQLDGEVQEVGKPFSNGLRFPGDPNGRPEEIYNCRCTLIAKLDGFDREKVERWDKLEGQSYEEWKAGGVLGPTGAKKTAGWEDRHAIRFYEEVRNRKPYSDAKKISANTPFTEKEIEDIRRHVFVDEHLLDGEMKRFVPDYEQAQAWQRLIDGKGTEIDILFLKHELKELQLLRDLGYNQEEAHALANELFNWWAELLKERRDK